MTSNSNKISIPKAVFENLFFQNGGQKQQALTGQFMYGLPEHLEEKANSEIEDSEYVQTKGTVVKAIGETHENGGIKTVLDSGDKVLSDHLKIGAELAKKLSKEYEIKIKPTDTYAKVLDKYLKKIGHTEATEEAERYIKMLDKQKDKVKDEATLALNQEILLQEIKEYGDKVNELEQPKLEMFSLLFKAQEDSKFKKEDKNNFQTGGQYPQNQQYYDDRGNTFSPNNPNNPLFYGKQAQPLPSQRVANIFEKPQYGYQPQNRDWKDFGNLNKEQQAEVLKDIGRVLPSLADKFLKEGVPKNSAEFQLSVNNHYDQLIKDAEKMYPKESQEYKQFIDNVNKERFTIPKNVKNIEGLVTDIDAKFGDYTSTRPNFAFDVLPQDILTEVNNAGVNTASELQKVFPDYFDKYVKPKGLNSDFYLGKVQPQVQTQLQNNNANIGTTEVPLQKPAQEPMVDVKQPLGFLSMPDRFLMSPNFRAPIKLTPTIYTKNKVEISPEQALTEINRGKIATEKQLEQLPDAQRAATLASMDANNAQAVSKVIAETSRYNAQAQEKQSHEEADARTKQSMTDAQASAQKQQLMGQKLEQFNRELQKINNTRFEDQFQKWMYVNQMNRNNALNRDVVFDGNQYYVTPEALKAQEERFKNAANGLSSEGSNNVLNEGATKRKNTRKRFV